MPPLDFPGRMKEPPFNKEYPVTPDTPFEPSGSAWFLEHAADLVNCFGATISKDACKKIQSADEPKWSRSGGWRPMPPKCAECPNREVTNDQVRKGTSGEAR